MNNDQYELIIFDADNTLRYCTVKNQPCPNKPNEWKLKNNVKEKLAEYSWGNPQERKTAYGIASNQGGVEMGYLGREMAFRLLVDMFKSAFGFSPLPQVIQLCTDFTRKDSECRKPQPGMLLKIMEYWKVAPHHTLFVGDMESDKETAYNAKCDFIWAEVFFQN